MACLADATAGPDGILHRKNATGLVIRRPTIPSIPQRGAARYLWNSGDCDCSPFCLDTRRAEGKHTRWCRFWLAWPAWRGEREYHFCLDGTWDGRWRRSWGKPWNYSGRGSDIAHAADWFTITSEYFTREWFVWPEKGDQEWPVHRNRDQCVLRSHFQRPCGYAQRTHLWSWDGAVW